MSRSVSRGHIVVYLNEEWVYEDNKELIDETRPCKLCGLPPVDGMDACIANSEGVKDACCGHGYNETAYVVYKDGSNVHGHECENACMNEITHLREKG